MSSFCAKAAAGSSETMRAAAARVLSMGSFVLFSGWARCVEALDGTATDTFKSAGWGQQPEKTGVFHPARMMGPSHVHLRPAPGDGEGDPEPRSEGFRAEGRNHP